MNMYKISVVILLILGATGCIDSASFSESPKEIKCWSGGIMIYDGYITGNTVRGSNYYRFRDETGRHVEVVGGNCVIIRE